MKRPVVDYPPGHFTEPVRAWFGQHWQPQGEFVSSLRSSAAATEARVDMQRERKGWKGGAIAGISRKADEAVTLQRLRRGA